MEWANLHQCIFLLLKKRRTKEWNWEKEKKVYQNHFRTCSGRYCPVEVTNSMKMLNIPCWNWCWSFANVCVKFIKFDIDIRMWIYWISIPVAQSVPFGISFWKAAKCQLVQHLAWFLVRLMRFLCANFVHLLKSNMNFKLDADRIAPRSHSFQTSKNN